MHVKREAGLSQTSPIEQSFFQESDDNLKTVFYTIARRKWWLLIPVAVILLLTVAALWVATPLYTAAATVLIEPRNRQVVDIEAVVPDRLADAEAVQNQIQVIRSPGLAAQVIEDLQLERYAELNPMIPVEANWWQRWVDAAFAWLPSEGDDGAAAMTPIEPSPAAAETDWPDPRVLEAFARRLNVEAIGRSSVIQISFASEDPNLAAEVANAVAETYIGRQVASDMDVTSEANTWLNQRLKELRNQLDEAERAVTEYRRENQLVAGRDPEIIRKQIGELTTQITAARAQVNEARIKLNGITETVEARGPRAVFEVANSPLAAQLREHEATLQQRRAELSQDYGPRHPIMVNLQSEIDSVSAQLNAEAQNLIAGAESAVRVAEQRLENLREMVGELQSELADLSGAEVELQTLQRRVDANRQLYETFLKRSLETEQMGLADADARVVSRAQAPLHPSFPNTPLVLGIAFVASLGLGGLMVIGAEQFASGFGSPKDAEEALGMRVLAAVPAVPARLRGDHPPQDYALEKPTSAYAEALRTLDLALVGLEGRRQFGRVVGVTSALPKEGKTSFVASLARILCLAGQRVLVIDCDLRRPQIHKAFNLSNQIGLSGYLSGQADFGRIVQTDIRSGVEVIVAGRPTENSLAMLRSPMLDTLLAEVVGKYDLILIDTAPVLPLSDTKTLARRCEFIVLAKWRETSRSDVMEAVKLLNGVGARFLGAALSQVDLKKIRAYSNGEYSYHRSYAMYHSN